MDIEKIIGKYVVLNKQGKNFCGLCHFHPEKTPSFIVNPKLQKFQCFSCGASGDSLEFIKLMIKDKKGGKFLIDAPDEETKENIALGLLSLETKIPIELIKSGKLTIKDYETLMWGAENLSKLPIFMGKLNGLDTAIRLSKELLSSESS